jgi:hypothetical protein
MLLDMGCRDTNQEEAPLNALVRAVRTGTKAFSKPYLCQFKVNHDRQTE